MLCRWVGSAAVVREVGVFRLLMTMRGARTEYVCVRDGYECGSRIEGT